MTVASTVAKIYFICSRIALDLSRGQPSIASPFSSVWQAAVPTGSDAEQLEQGPASPGSLLQRRVPAVVPTCCIALLAAKGGTAQARAVEHTCTVISSVS